jgi:NADH-quinone oxidoreductase subunit M
LQNSTLLSAVVFLPLLGALLLMLVPRGEKALLRGGAFTISLLVFIVSLFLWAGFDASPNAPEFQFKSDATINADTWIGALGASYHIGIDGVSLVLIILTTFLMPIILLSAHGAIDHRVKEFVISFLVLETAMIGTLCALDMILFYIFWEAMLFPMYLLVGVWGGEQRIYATLKFFLYTMVGSVLMLVAILYLHYQTGMTSFDFFIFRDLTHGGPLTQEQDAQWWLFMAFALAFAIKVPMFPLHTWLPDAHVQAPTAGSVVLAGVLLKMGTYGFYRFAIPLFPQAAVDSAPLIAWLSVIGIIYGALVAWVQADVKKLVAYSSVSHLGFVMLGLIAGHEMAANGAVMQMINHGLSTPALFLCVGVLYERRHTKQIDQYGGIAKEMPVFTVVFALAMFSSIGLPGLNGFIGEFLVLSGSFLGTTLHQQEHWLTMLAATGVILGAVYMLSMFQKVMFGPVKNPQNRGLPDLSMREGLVFAPLIISFFLLGLYPNLILDRIGPSVKTFVKSYVPAEVTRPAPAPAPAPEVKP